MLTSATKILLKGPLATARADHLALGCGEAQVLAATVVHSAEREFAWVAREGVQERKRGGRISDGRGCMWNRLA